MNLKGMIPKLDRFNMVRIGKIAAIGALAGQGPKKVVARVVIEGAAAAALYGSVFGQEAHSVDRYYHDREAQSYKLRYILLEKNIRELATSLDDPHMAAALRSLIHRSDLEAQS